MGVLRHWCVSSDADGNRCLGVCVLGSGSLWMPLRETYRDRGNPSVHDSAGVL